MAKVIFEYRDETGRVHQVQDLKDVPRKYMKTMTAIGVDEAEGTAAAVGQSPPASSGGKNLPATVEKANLLIPLTLLVVFWRFENFLVKCMAVVAAVLWFFLYGYDTFMNSDWSRTANDTQSHAEKLREMQPAVAPKKAPASQQREEEPPPPEE